MKVSPRVGPHRNCTKRRHTSPDAAFIYRHFSVPRRGGFALVAVILVVSLITVMAVVTAITIRVEVQAASNTRKQSQARENALFGLNTALAQLQKEAGPDQCTTARADILDVASTELRNTVVKQPLWTGVWKTNKPGAGDQQLDTGSAIRAWSYLPENTRWLVSELPGKLPDPRLGPQGPNKVTLAKYRVPAGTTAEVEVTKLDITETVPAGTTRVTGGYGYWVSDEGVKTKVNLGDPTSGRVPASVPSTKLALNQLHFLAPQRPVGEKIYDVAFQGKFPAVLSDVNKVQSLPSLPSLFGPEALLFSQQMPLYLPDVTTYSKGVLADVRNGGLKMDLTAVFEDPALFKSLFMVSRATANLYRVSDCIPPLTAVQHGTSSSWQEGLRWESLFYFYNLYKDVSPSVYSGTRAIGMPTSFPEGVKTPATLPYSLAPRMYTVDKVPGTNSDGTFIDTLAPVPLAVRMETAVSSFFEGGKWRLRLNYYPELVMYNPYSVRLTPPPNTRYQIESNMMNGIQFNQFQCAAEDLRSIVSYQRGTNPAAPHLMHTTSDIGRWNLSTKAGEADSFAPGEIRVFALSKSSREANSVNTAIVEDLESASATVSGDFAKYFDLAWAGTADGNATVTIRLNNTTFTGNAGYIKSNYVAYPGNSYNANPGRFIYGSIAVPDFTPTGTATNISRPISTLTSPMRIMGAFVRFKGLKTDAPSTYVNQNNARPIFMGNAPQFNMLDPTLTLGSQEIYGRAYDPYISTTDIQMFRSDEGTHWSTSWGEYSAGAMSTGSRIILRDVPTQPMVSLGQFMHLPARSSAGSGNWSIVPFGSTFIGGSLAPVAFPLDTTGKVQKKLGFNDDDGYMDNSFMANERLWDKYFLSTVPTAARNFSKYPLPAPSPMAFGTAQLADDQVLPNTRLKYYRRNGTDPTVADLRSHTKAASNLLLDGAFNVNSTSVPAWKALLSSMTGNDLEVWNAATRSQSKLASADLKNAIPRFLSAVGPGSVNSPWNGIRSLSDDEVTQLATRIVEQVKLRGPFLSMGDFLNRRLGATPSDLTLKGALQAAIDTTTPDLNAAAKSQGIPVSIGDPSRFIPPLTTAQLPANTAIGMPGYLMQEDLVQAFSPGMAARSDTFVVRCYGETRNFRTKAVEGRAWGEAVVQRLPDYVESKPLGNAAGDDPETAPASLTSNLNKTLGRRFQVVSFRWLNESDI